MRPRWLEGVPVSLESNDPMEEIVGTIVETMESGRRAVLVTPVESKGSLPTGRYARMLVFDDGSILGTVGGGRMEADAAEMALAAMREGDPRLVWFSLTAEDALEEGALCGGRAAFFVEPLSASDVDPFVGMRRMLEKQTRGVEAVVLSEDSPVRRLVLGSSGERVGTLGSSELDRRMESDLEAFLEREDPWIEEIGTEEGKIRVYVRPVKHRPTVYLFGGGHVGWALSRLVPMIGMRLIVVDDRPEFCSRERFPMADGLYVREFSRALDGLEIDETSYVVIMTRGHKWDRDVLAQALRTRAGYIGMIGSRRKIALIWESLKAEGFTDADLSRVHAPIGLDIGGDTPGEIAVSIAAELIQVRRKGREEEPERDSGN